nr:MAG TPA: hypothetical protein [Caudoviricetes sp.]
MVAVKKTRSDRGEPAVLSQISQASNPKKIIAARSSSLIMLLLSKKKPITHVRVIGVRSVVGVVGLDGIELIEVIVLKLLRSLDLGYRANGHKGECGRGCKDSSSGNQLLAVALDSGNEILLVELELDNGVGGLDGGVVGVHGGFLSSKGIFNIGLVFLAKAYTPW